MYIKVKGLNNRLVFIFEEQVAFESLMRELESLLKEPMFSTDGFFPKAFFDFKSRILTDEEVQLLLDVIFNEQVIVFDGISGIKEEETAKMQVINRTIHAGEVVSLEQDTLIIGHINPGAIVKFDTKLYVLGKVSGMVEGKNPESIISGQCFDQAHIRINGVSRHVYTSLELTMLYYRDNDIYLDKGEMIYV